MVRRGALSCLVVALAVAALVFTRAASAADKPEDAGAAFVGKWEKDEGDVKAVITIDKKGDDWSVSGVYLNKDGQEVGNFTGKSVKYLPNSGELSYISHHDKNPPGHGGLNDAAIWLKVKDGVMIETWRHGKSHGTHKWTAAK